ncbi:hypothetical protein [Sphingobium indicum]|uniref:hypothetical protein n=1 Tax=Sphingobium indicum TaxID=332055 RepID=UPI001F3E2401|nr:hypothetical protein [Sphingobium indicum]
MDEAMLLLDAASEPGPAAHLQMAHDLTLAALREADPGPLQKDDELVLHPAATRALGGALALFASVLQSRGVIPRAELASLLAIYATTTGKTDQREGLLLACWAGMLRESCSGALEDCQGEASGN